MECPVCGPVCAPQHRADPAVVLDTALRQGDRAERSIREHVAIISALEARDADLAERLVREHGLGLAQHVDTYGDYLD